MFRSRTATATALMCAAITTATIGPAASAAAPGNYISSVTYTGTGCNADNTQTELSEDRRTLTVTFSQFTVEDGPGVPASQRRRNCRVTLNIYSPLNTTYNIITTYNGFVDSDAGRANGQLNTTTAGALTPTNQTYNFPKNAYGTYQTNANASSLLPGLGNTQPAIINTNANIRAIPGGRGELTVDSIKYTIN